MGKLYKKKRFLNQKIKRQRNFVGEQESTLQRGISSLDEGAFRSDRNGVSEIKIFIFLE